MPNSQKDCAPLYVLGLGPGNSGLLTSEALMILKFSHCIVGYRLYMDLLPQSVKADKTLIASGVHQEKERCVKAIESALSGRITTLVSSGDPGIYAMASLVIELLEKEKLLEEVPLEIVPGVPALCAAAARLGAPISHDFACISLSDLLTPWELIEKRLECALAGDFVCVLYNPRSKGRPDYLAIACQMALKWRKGSCPVGLARNVYRTGEETILTTLDNFDPQSADMLSLIIIGNSQSRMCGKYMLTPRGYFAAQD